MSKVRYQESLPTIDVEEFRKVVMSRRSVRRFEATPIPSEVLEDCLDLAMLAPNSSNLQPWAFYVVQSEDARRQLARACLGQNAARTAPVLVVIVARTATWRHHCDLVLSHWPESSIPPVVQNYYGRLAKISYTQGPLNVFGIGKRLVAAVAGLGRPVPRGPSSHADMRVWAVKSTALAAENLMLALRAHGYDSCPMEGFDARRVGRQIKLPADGEIVMVLAAGKRAADGVYHARFRFGREHFVKYL